MLDRLTAEQARKMSCPDASTYVDEALKEVAIVATSGRRRHGLNGPFWSNEQETTTYKEVSRQLQKLGYRVYWYYGTTYIEW